MSKMEASSESISTTETAFCILELLMEMNGAQITELANRLGVSNSTVHRHLTTLKNNHYVIQEGNTYDIGLKFLHLGQYAQNRNDVRVLAKQNVENLAEKTGEWAQFFIKEFGYAVPVQREIGTDAVRTDPGLGKQIPIHATAAGKAILAHLPDSTVEDIIESYGLPPLTPNTITDEAELWEELDEIQDRGFSFNRQENVKGLRAVGTAVTCPDGEVAGAMSVSGPTERMKDDWFRTEIPELLLGSANELELNIAYS